MDTKHWIQHIGREIEEPLRYFYSQQAYGDCLRGPNGTELAYKNIHFWKLFSTSVQRSLFIGLGRLFDGVSGARSFPKFQGHCMQNMNAFSKSALAERRVLENGGVRPEYLDNYLSGCSEISKEDIGKLFSPISSINGRARDIYQRIRSKTIAHAISTEENEYSELFISANNDEIEKILLTLWGVYRNIWELYYNGNLPNKGYLTYEYKFKNECYESTKKAFYNIQ